MEKTTKAPTRVRSFLTKKGVSLSPKTYFVDAMGAMALGLFASLLMATIFGTILKYVPEGNVFYDLLSLLSRYAPASGGATGAILGVAVAYALKAPALVLFASGVVGMCGNDMITVITAADGAAKSVAAGPAGAFLCVLVACEVGKLVAGETKVDILVTPAVTLTAGMITAMLICPAVAYVMYWLGYFINYATTILPFFMGIIISVVVGIILTLPISSAAVCAMIGITGLAGGAAVAGCCAQMVGFAVISFRENRWGGVVAQGLGTSMLQMGNIVKRPIIWLPPTLAAAITGPVSTCLFKLECTGVSAGMGTCGLVGPIGVFSSMGFTANSIFGVLVVCLLLPAVLSLVFSEIMRKLGWIREGDLKLEL
ncbi:MAG: PTS sugar transporter subunit IIC [Clostridia bacterium]|nr:PTS sugar transporter subunit IIC [Clostridia bacterium]